MVTQGKIRERISTTNWFLYALKLENDKYYIGVTINVKNRFSQHQRQRKSSSKWCKQHKPIEIIESIETSTKRLIDAMVLEDLLTQKYMKKYGAENVRGGKYLGSGTRVANKFNRHSERNFITIRHLLFTKLAIGYQELVDLKIIEFINDFQNSELLFQIINENKDKSVILEKITKYT